VTGLKVQEGSSVRSAKLENQPGQAVLWLDVLSLNSQAIDGRILSTKHTFNPVGCFGYFLIVLL
jgi:hypothetical protein